MAEPVRIGTKFTSAISGDAVPWVVIDSAEPGSWTCVSVGKEPCLKRVFSGAQINGCKELDRTIRAYKTKLEVYPGEIVHYHDGHDNYVRCIGAEGGLRAIALVGNWGRHHLPRYDAYGAVHYPEWSGRVIRGETIEADASAIYEACPERFSDDPRNMPPIDLTPAPMTAPEASMARAWKGVRDARNALESRSDPITILRQARMISDMALAACSMEQPNQPSGEEHPNG